jgi:hypothetical protein
MSHDEIVAEYRKIGFDESTAEAYTNVFENGEQPPEDLGK